jgi:hypothetical protein
MPEPGDRGNPPDVLAVVPSNIVGEPAHRPWRPELGLRYRRGDARERTPFDASIPVPTSQEVVPATTC